MEINNRPETDIWIAFDVVVNFLKEKLIKMGVLYADIFWIINLQVLK